MSDLDIVERVRLRMPELSASERRVAQTVLASPGRLTGLSAARLAVESDTSVGTVVRFCHALGFPGFQDFKMRLAIDVNSARPAAELLTARPTDDSAEAVLGRTLMDLARAVDSIDVASIRVAAGVVVEARRILIVAAGPSQPLAMALGQWLSRNGHAASYPTDRETQEAIARRMDPEDVCIAISHSGTTEATLAPARAAQDRGARIVALTSFPGTPIAALADAAIVAGAPADPFRSADMASRPVHLTVLHALSAAIQDAHR